jgi:hypothetical protein
VAFAGYWIAHVTFWVLEGLAVLRGDVARAVAFAALWLIGYAGSWWLPQGGTLFVSYVALLDVALVLFMKADVPLT